MKHDEVMAAVDSLAALDRYATVESVAGSLNSTDLRAVEDSLEELIDGATLAKYAGESDTTAGRVWRYERLVRPS